jgi:adenylosuccinate synthase
MRTAKVIIGAAWGDEGKGLLTDAFAGPATLVVRFNGGAQAGHTVVTPDGRHHVFHHIGGGSFREAGTFLSRYFISNPLLFASEIEALREIGVFPNVSADPEGMVTTPYDMMLNQMAEEARGRARHGSCGLGINETVTRNETSGIPPLTIGDLGDGRRVAERLRDIRRLWVPRRLAALGAAPDAAWQSRLDGDAVIAAFVDLAGRFAERVVFAAEAIAAHPGPVIFEGAQGLLLDEGHRWFPHVTRSRTGIANVDALARNAGIEALDVVYATRAYATRHGAGPFPREAAGLSYEDKTNVPNPWQQALRFGHLDLDLTGEAIQDDLERTRLPVRLSLAITCLDQVGDEVKFWHRCTPHIASRERLLQCVRDEIAGNCIASYGPTRSTLAVEERDGANVSPTARILPPRNDGFWVGGGRSRDALCTDRPPNRIGKIAEIRHFARMLALAREPCRCQAPFAESLLRAGGVQ